MEKYILEQLLEKHLTVLKDDVSFARRIKEWVVKDYYNPRIKAEVILNTLLSEDIEKLVGNMICQEKGINSLPGKVTLLAREFPIDNFKEADNRNRAVDYLVSYTGAKGKDNKLFFVELKTTDKNFDNTQLGNYIRFCGRLSGKYSGVKKYDYRLFPFFFYKKVCTEGNKPGVTKTTCKIALNGAQNLDDVKKEKRERRDIAFYLKDNAKYVFQLAEICRVLQENKEVFQKVLPEASWPKDDFCFHKRLNDISKLLEDIEEVFKDYKICLVYISMMNIASDIEEAINNIKEKDMNLISGNVYNITLVNDYGPKSEYVKVYNGFSVLSGYMRDILERIVKYKIDCDAQKT